MVGDIFVKKIDFSTGYEPDFSRMKGLAKNPSDLKITANVMTFFRFFLLISLFFPTKLEVFMYNLPT
jgi:hypothetical protein